MLWVFWRILFDVICGHVSLRKEFTVWETTNRNRLSNGTIAIEWEPIGDVYIHADRVEFRDGYLKCHDKRLNVGAWFPQRTGLSQTNKGENVSIWAEVNLPNWAEVNLPNKGKIFPIFYYPQDTNPNPNYLALSVKVPASPSTRSINWNIEQEGYSNGDPYRISGRDGWHRVRVRQDQHQGEAGRATNYFEFLVDSVPCGISNIVGNGIFTFDDNYIEKDFYIGRAPDPDNPDNWFNLNGDLRQLEFDPNDSCTSCG